MMKLKTLISLACGLLIAFSAQSQKTYTFDKNHARLGFSATHFGISNVEGTFRILEANLKSEKEDFSDAAIEMKADAKSVNTDNEMRDKDLRSPDWLNVEKYPAIVFKSSSFKKMSDRNYKLEGTVTIKGVTKPVVFDVIYNGKVMNPMLKKNVAGFTITGKLNRSDFGVGTDAFAAVVGKEIDVRSNVEFIVDNDAVGSK
jgi:polyisoprenoid-binding protein YceI